MSETLNLLLLEDNPGDARIFREYLAAQGGFTLEVADTLAQALGILAQREFHAIVCDLMLPDSRGLETFRKLREHARATPLIVLSGTNDEELALDAVREGAQDYLVKGQQDQVALARAIRYAVERHKRQPSAAEHKRARVVSFIGAKGGTGTTSVALNVASCWAREGHSVILCEIRSSSGSLASQVGVAPAGNLSGLLGLDLESIDERALNSRLCRLASGLRVLFGPQRPVEYKPLEGDHVRALVNAMAQSADYVVLDLPTEYSDGIRAAVQGSDYTTVVLETEPVALAAAKKVIEFLEGCGLGRRVLGAVAVHRTPLVNVLTVNEIRSSLACALIGVAPPSGDAFVSANKSGIPLVLSRPEASYSVAIGRLATRLAMDQVPAMDA